MHMTLSRRTLRWAALIFPLLLATMPGLLAPGAVRAMTLEPVEDSLFGCAVELTGKIEEGDAAKLARRIDDGTFDGGARLCLNSPGGDFIEALVMSRLIFSRAGTAIDRDKACEGACAIVFMAGAGPAREDRKGATPRDAWTADRLLHPKGKLAFSSPAEGVDADDALALAAVLIRETAGRGMPASLISAMMHLPEDTPLVIDSVGQAARWNIAVAPTVAPEALSYQAMANACNNWLRARGDNPEASSYYGEKPVYALGNAPPKITTNGKGKGKGVTVLLSGMGNETCQIVLPHGLDGKGHPGFADSALAGRADNSRDSRLGRIGGEGRADHKLFAAMFFPPKTPIAELIRNDDRTAQAVALEDRGGAISDRSVGECFQFENGNLKEREHCTSQVELHLPANGQYRVTQQFQWNAGDSTNLTWVDASDGQARRVIDVRPVPEALDGAPVEEAFTPDRLAGRGGREINAGICGDDDGKILCQYECWRGDRRDKWFCFKPGGGLRPFTPLDPADAVRRLAVVHGSGATLIALDAPKRRPSVDTSQPAPQVTTAAPSENMARLAEKARAGNADAQYQLARAYRFGKGVKKDQAQAFKWYHAAAKKGHDKAQFNLSVMYLNGQGVKANPAEAVRWMERAAEQGNPNAQYRMGDYAEKGVGMRKDPDFAVQWYEQAANKGHAKAKAALDRLYNNTGSVRYEEHRPQDDHRHEDDYRPRTLDQARNSLPQNEQRQESQPIQGDIVQAAEQGNTRAQYELARRYATGEGMPKDMGKASFWIRKAANGDYAPAQYQLAKMFLSGKGMPRDPATGARWMERAATFGLADAQFAMGQLFEMGVGVRRNQRAALHWYNQAATQGHRQARTAMMELRN